jgi:DNA repair exonuclease SbcCD ATPase subunit
LQCAKEEQNRANIIIKQKVQLLEQQKLASEQELRKSTEHVTNLERQVQLLEKQNHQQKLASEKELKRRAYAVIKLEQQIRLLKGQSAQLTRQLEVIQTIPAEIALESALNRFDGQRNEQVQEEETNESIADVDAVFEQLQEVQNRISNHVKTQLEQRLNDTDVEMVDERNECVDKVRSALERAMKLLEREQSQQAKERNNSVLMKKVEQWLKIEDYRAKKHKERVQRLERLQEHVKDDIDAYIKRFDTKKDEVENIVQKLKNAEKESAEYTIQVRNLKNKIDLMKQQGIVKEHLKSKLEQLKNKRNQAGLLVTELKLELVHKSREEGSLREYELMVSSIKSTRPVQSPDTELFINDYVVERELAGGVQARVYLCRTKNDEHVVVKVYQVYSLSDAETGINEVR